MESLKTTKKRAARNDLPNSDLQDSEDLQQDAEMNDSSATTQPQRKIVKIKKRAENIPAMDDEDDIENGIIYSEEEFEEENIVERNDDYDDEQAWEDVNSQKSTEMMQDEMQDEVMELENQGGSKKKEIWDETKEPLKEGEELVFDNSAYQMLHRAKVEWPCLSIDIILRDRVNHHSQNNSWFPQYANEIDPKSQMKDKHGNMVHKHDKFPYTVYFCAGSQSLKKNENKIYAMKWSDMQKTLKDDDEINEGESDEEVENDKDPDMRFECVPHKGCVNRIRSMHGTGIVATWNDENEVGIYNISQAIEALDITPSQDKKKKKEGYGGSKVAAFKHADEGYALDWSPLTWGRLASGGCNSQIFLYTPADETCSSFVKESTVGLQGHRKSVEDVQFSPSQENVLASCSVDQTIKLWDLRATQMKAQLSFRAHDCDVNVISWNTTTKFLLASGDDKGEFRIWDLRMLKSTDGVDQKNFDSITRIRWHTSAITSLQFEPGEESVLAVSSADNKLTLWDFSVEVDESQQNVDDDIPPQLMFLHQGQNNMKELRFHPYYKEMIITTAEDSYNIFRPNLEPEEDDLEPIESGINSNEESKASDKTAASQKGQNFYIDSDGEDEEEERMIKTAKKLNSQRNDAKDKKSKDGKRRKIQ